VVIFLFGNKKINLQIR